MYLPPTSVNVLLSVCQSVTRLRWTQIGWPETQAEVFDVTNPLATNRPRRCPRFRVIERANVLGPVTVN